MFFLDLVSQFTEKTDDLLSRFDLSIGPCFSRKGQFLCKDYSLRYIEAAFVVGGFHNLSLEHTPLQFSFNFDQTAMVIVDQQVPRKPRLLGGVPAGRHEGAQYERKLPYREAPPFRAWSFTSQGLPMEHRNPLLYAREDRLRERASLWDYGTS